MMIHKIIELQNIIFLVALHVDRCCCRFIVVKLVLLFTSVHKSTNPTYAGTIDYSTFAEYKYAWTFFAYLSSFTFSNNSTIYFYEITLRRNVFAPLIKSFASLWENAHPRFTGPPVFLADFGLPVTIFGVFGHNQVCNFGKGNGVIRNYPHWRGNKSIFRYYSTLCVPSHFMRPNLTLSVLPNLYVVIIFIETTRLQVQGPSRFD